MTITKPAEKPKFAAGAEAAVIAPDSTKQEKGWIAEEPAFEHFNWIHKWNYNWIEYFEQVTDDHESRITANETALSNHGHSISGISGLQTALDEKSSSSHTHPTSDVTGLQTILESLVKMEVTETKLRFATLGSGGSVGAYGESFEWTNYHQNFGGNAKPTITRIGANGPILNTTAINDEIMHFAQVNDKGEPVPLNTTLFPVPSEWIPFSVIVDGNAMVVRAQQYTHPDFGVVLRCYASDEFTSGTKTWYRYLLMRYRDSLTQDVGSYSWVKQ